MARGRFKRGEHALVVDATGAELSLHHTIAIAGNFLQHITPPAQFPCLFTHEKQGYEIIQLKTTAVSSQAQCTIQTHTVILAMCSQSDRVLPTLKIGTFTIDFQGS